MSFLIMLAVLLALVVFEAPMWCFFVYTVMAFILCWRFIRKVNEPA
jgi:hypothetical protein